MELLKPNPIMDGVEDDLSAFMYKVMRSGVTEFADFVAQWNEHFFCYIYSKRNRIREMQYFTREILILAKKYCLNERPRLEKVMGVFLLYSLYYTQPLINPTRIRIERNEFEGLLTFIEGESKEVRYCFFKLLLDHAFEYVYDDKLYSLERVREREVHIRQRQAKVMRAKASNKVQWDQLCKSVDFDQHKWLATETTYNQLKSSINETLGTAANFEMTEFLKPLMTISTASISDDVDIAEQEGTEAAKTKSPSKKTTGRKTRRRAACTVLFEGSSSSEEEAMGGSGSMPQLRLDELQNDASDGDS
ncbi:Hypothetical proteinall nuclear RNA activating complex, polypeptide 1, 43kDa [Nesidiocoris tenuis]|uniref:Small nuclear RNA activating complex polypeptide 1 n=1 Tax=Nesidiocoris tenuis TaxID=355587 RepID=A0ABN7AXP7_9HEMI|nr:Hypothetical proteinall nuclear RNA activating complex, polypeptide 1, 43kDa [Nesidiocoris tenuis]